MASVAGLLLAAANGVAQPDATAPSAPVPLSYGVADVLKLSQARIGTDTIVAFIENSGTSYNLTAPEIVYLKSQGVADPVITTMLNQRRKLTEAFAHSQPAATVTPAVNAGASAPQYVANYTPPATTYAQPASTVYVIPSSPSYSYPYYGYAPYYGGYYGYSSYPGWSLSVGFGTGWYGGYYGGGYCGPRYYGNNCYNGGNYNRPCYSGGRYNGAPYRGGNYQGAQVQTASYRGGGSAGVHRGGSAYAGNSGGGYRTAANFSGGSRGGGRGGRH